MRQYKFFNRKIKILSTVLLLSGTASHADPLPSVLSVSQMTEFAVNEPRKNILIRQGILEAPLKMNRLQIIEKRGYDFAYTTTGAVIDVVANELICILDGRYKIQDARYDDATKAMLTDFKLDESEPNVICQGFSGNNMQCTIRHGQKRVGYTGGNLSIFQNSCLEQLSEFVVSSIAQ